MDLQNRRRFPEHEAELDMELFAGRGILDAKLGVGPRGQHEREAQGSHESDLHASSIGFASGTL